MNKVNSEMVADVIAEIGVGSRFPHKSKKSRESFYEDVANELNYLLTCPSDSMARLFGDYLATNGIDVAKFNRVIEQKYKVGLFQGDLSQPEEKEAGEQAQEESQGEVADEAENPDVEVERDMSDNEIEEVSQAVKDYLNCLGLYDEQELADMVRLLQENDENAKKTKRTKTTKKEEKEENTNTEAETQPIELYDEDELEFDIEDEEPNLKKASTPFAAIRQFAASALEWFTNQHYKTVNLEDAREISEIEGMLKDAELKAEEQKPHIKNEPKKGTKHKCKGAKGEAAKKQGIVEQLKFKTTREYLEGLEDFSDRVTSQAKALCESRKVEDCKTSLGLELESVRSKDPIDLEEIQQLRARIEKARNAQIEGLRDVIDSMQTLQVETALSKFRFSPDILEEDEPAELSDKEIEDILYGIRPNGRNTRNQREEETKEPEEDGHEFGGKVGRVLLGKNGQETLGLAKESILFIKEIPRILVQQFNLNVTPTIEVDDRGNLVIENSRLRVEDLLEDAYIDNNPLYERLRLLAIMPRAIDLNGTEILQLAHCMSFKDGEIKIDFEKLNDGKVPGDRSWYDRYRDTNIPRGWINPEALDDLRMPDVNKLQYMENMEGSLFYDSVQVKEFERLRSGKWEDFGVYDRALLELEALENLRECQLFAEQVTELGDRYDIITDGREKDSGFTKKEKKSLDALRKAAGDKVKTLQKKGFNIYDIVWRDKETEVKLLQKGKEYFVEDEKQFRDSLESARKAGQKNLDKLRDLQDGPEEPDEQDVEDVEK